MKSGEDRYYLCFYNLQIGDHKHYHHLIIKTDNVSEIKSLEGPNYAYFLKSVLEISSKKMTGAIAKSLMMDGESFIKRLKKKS
jgi:hypothetical protein